MTSLEPAIARQKPAADRSDDESQVGQTRDVGGPTPGFIATPGVVAGPTNGVSQLRQSSTAAKISGTVIDAAEMPAAEPADPGRTHRPVPAPLHIAGGPTGTLSGSGAPQKDARAMAGASAETAGETDRPESLQKSQAELEDEAEEVRLQNAANKSAIEDLVLQARPLIGKIYGKTVKGQVPAPAQVQEALGFDREQLHQRLLALLSALKPLRAKGALPTADDVATVQKLVSELEVRLDEDSTFVEDIKPRTPHEMATSEDPTVVNSNMRIAWRSFAAEAAKPNRDMKSCRAKIAEIAAEVDRKTPVTDAALDALIKAEPANKASAQGKIDKHRKGLLAMMPKGSEKRVAKQCLEQEPRVSSLFEILNQADDVQRVPTLLARAKQGGTSSAQLAAILKKSGKDTAKVSSLFAKVVATGKSLHYFVLGEGGQPADTLLASLPNVWAGAECPEPEYQPTGTTFEKIAAEAVPKMGRSGPAEGGYAGNRDFGNSGRPPDQLLPTRSVAGGDIAYTEFDIKPWQRGVDRGGERVVRGSDGRRYFTADHYRTFKKIH